MAKIQEQLDQLNNQRDKLLSLSNKLLATLNKQKSNKTIKCGCGAMHKIKDCIAIQSHHYIPPRGCTEGDYWNPGELQVICPVTDYKNRLLFDSLFTVPYNIRYEFEHNAEMQFKSKYKHLFKEVIDDYDTDTRNWWNNYYVDTQLTKFDITI